MRSRHVTGHHSPKPEASHEAASAWGRGPHWVSDLPPYARRRAGAGGAHSGWTGLWFVGRPSEFASGLVLARARRYAHRLGSAVVAGGAAARRKRSVGCVGEARGRGPHLPAGLRTRRA